MKARETKLEMLTLVTAAKPGLPASALCHFNLIGLTNLFRARLHRPPKKHGWLPARRSK
jgi:hypothetical protein